MNKRGDIPVTVLVIGVVLVCCLALITFSLSTTKVRGSFVGIGAIENMNSQIENDSFYKISGNAAVNSGDISSAFNYAKENDVVSRRCNCGNNCDSYAGFVTNSASRNGMDPILLLSLMMQESTCASWAFSGSSTGLMQINLIHCGEYGLPTNQDQCKKELIGNPQLNIEVGAEILKQSYDTYSSGKIFQGCSNRNIFYSGWEAALRGYNGWGCGKDAAGNVFYAQDNYVEEVMSRYEALKQIAGYSGVTGKGSIFDLETTNQFPFIQRKDKFLFSAKFTEQ